MIIFNEEKIQNSKDILCYNGIISLKSYDMIIMGENLF